MGSPFDAFGYPGKAFHDMRFPPAIRDGPGKGQRYDSLLAQVETGKYREFIVYDRAQAYPERIVGYKHRNDPAKAAPK